MKKNILLLATIFLQISYSFAQHSCGMDHVHENWRKTTPEYANLEKADTSTRETNRRAKLIIPIVFHVLHTNGPENISKEQILDQLRILNEDFSKSNANIANIRNTANAPFRNMVADMEIEFRLAKIDPNGNCTDGINRIYTPAHVNAGDNVKGIIRWNVNKYLNVWVVSTINNNDPTGTILGYANFPFMNASTDGIVIRSDYMGTVGTGNVGHAGRTLTHEVGHYIGLFHTFQGGCTGNGDQVNDTPPVASSSVNASCPANGNSCPSSSTLDMWENYMDYSNGGCQGLFTNGQKNRALFFFTNPPAVSSSPDRRVLISAQNLVETGVEPNFSQAPLAYFSADKNIVCTDEPVQFFDNSCKGQVSSRTWLFDGANVSQSSQPNPTISYSTPGVYKVTLKVQNTFGNTERVENNYIRVLPKVASIAGVAESFENTTTVNNTLWSQLSGDGMGNFEVQSNAAFFGSKSILAELSKTATGTRYIIESPSINLKEIGNLDPKISFMVGHARRNSSTFDILRIYISKDCGATWEQRLQRVSGQLAGRQGFFEGFVPSQSSDWVRVTLNLLEYREETNVRVRIEIEDGGGNDMYLDDINISQFFTSVPNLSKNIDFSISPNPVDNGVLSIQLLSLELNSPIEIDLIDINGRKVATVFKGNTDSKEINKSLNLNELNLNKGIYLIKVKSSDGVLTKKVIFAN